MEIGRVQGVVVNEDLQSAGVVVVYGDWQNTGESCLWRLAMCREWFSVDVGRVQGVAVYGDWQSAGDGCLRRLTECKSELSTKTGRV